MKRILILLIAALALVPAVNAQQSAFEQAVSKYRNAKTATASAVMVKHNNAMSKDKSYSGALYMKDPDKVAITVNNGKDQLVMNGDVFTMVQNGHKRVASAKTASQFAAFKAVLKSVLSGGTPNISKIQGVNVQTEGGNVVVTITPAKAKRMMFTSFVLSIDRKSGALEALWLNSKRGYTKYTFTGFKFGSAVNDKVFRP